MSEMNPYLLFSRLIKFNLCGDAKVVPEFIV